MLMGNFITEERLFMEIRQGYSYHIKDEFFDLVQDKYLMSNKEQENYRHITMRFRIERIQKYIGWYRLVHKQISIRESLRRKRKDMVNAIQF